MTCNETWINAFVSSSDRTQNDDDFACSMQSVRLGKLGDGKLCASIVNEKSCWVLPTWSLPYDIGGARAIGGFSQHPLRNVKVGDLVRMSKDEFNTTTSYLTVTEIASVDRLYNCVDPVGNPNAKDAIPLAPFKFFTGHTAHNRQGLLINARNVGTQNQRHSHRFHTHNDGYHPDMHWYLPNADTPFSAEHEQIGYVDGDANDTRPLHKFVSTVPSGFKSITYGATDAKTTELETFIDPNSGMEVVARTLPIPNNMGKITSLTAQGKGRYTGAIPDPTQLYFPANDGYMSAASVVYKTSAVEMEVQVNGSFTTAPRGGKVASVVVLKQDGYTQAAYAEEYNFRTAYSGAFTHSNLTLLTSNESTPTPPAQPLIVDVVMDAQATHLVFDSVTPRTAHTDNYRVGDVLQMQNAQGQNILVRVDEIFLSNGTTRAGTNAIHEIDSSVGFVDPLPARSFPGYDVLNTDVRNSSTTTEIYVDGEDPQSFGAGRKVITTQTHSDNTAANDGKTPIGVPTGTTQIEAVGNNAGDAGMIELLTPLNIPSSQTLTFQSRHASGYNLDDPFTSAANRYLAITAVSGFGVYGADGFNNLHVNIDNPPIGPLVSLTELKIPTFDTAGLVGDLSIHVRRGGADAAIFKITNANVMNVNESGQYPNVDALLGNGLSGQMITVDQTTSLGAGRDFVDKEPLSVQARYTVNTGGAPGSVMKEGTAKAYIPHLTQLRFDNTTNADVKSLVPESANILVNRFVIGTKNIFSQTARMTLVQKVNSDLQLEGMFEHAGQTITVGGVSIAPTYNNSFGPYGVFKPDFNTFFQLTMRHLTFTIALRSGSLQTTVNGNNTARAQSTDRAAGRIAHVGQKYRGNLSKFVSITGAEAAQLCDEAGVDGNTNPGFVDDTASGDQAPSAWDTNEVAINLLVGKYTPDMVPFDTSTKNWPTWPTNATEVESLAQGTSTPTVLKNNRLITRNMNTAVTSDSGAYEDPDGTYNTKWSGLCINPEAADANDFTNRRYKPYSYNSTEERSLILKFTQGDNADAGVFHVAYSDDGFFPNSDYQGEGNYSSVTPRTSTDANYGNLNVGRASHNANGEAHLMDNRSEKFYAVIYTFTPTAEPGKKYRQRVYEVWPTDVAPEVLVHAEAGVTTQIDTHATQIATQVTSYFASAYPTTGPSAQTNSEIPGIEDFQNLTAAMEVRGSFVNLVFHSPTQGYINPYAFPNPVQTFLSPNLSQSAVTVIVPNHNGSGYETAQTFQLKHTVSVGGSQPSRMLVNYTFDFGREMDVLAEKVGNSLQRDLASDDSVARGPTFTTTSHDLTPSGEVWQGTPRATITLTPRAASPQGTDYAKLSQPVLAAMRNLNFVHSTSVGVTGNSSTVRPAISTTRLMLGGANGSMDGIIWGTGNANWRLLSSATDITTPLTLQSGTGTGLGSFKVKIDSSVEITSDFNYHYGDVIRADFGAQIFNPAFAGNYMDFRVDHVLPNVQVASTFNSNLGVNVYDNVPATVTGGTGTVQVKLTLSRTLTDMHLFGYANQDVSYNAYDYSGGEHGSSVQKGRKYSKIEFDGGRIALPAGASAEIHTADGSYGGKLSVAGITTSEYTFFLRDAIYLVTTTATDARISGVTGVPHDVIKVGSALVRRFRIRIPTSSAYMINPGRNVLDTDFTDTPVNPLMDESQSLRQYVPINLGGVQFTFTAGDGWTSSTGVTIQGMPKKQLRFEMDFDNIGPVSFTYTGPVNFTCERPFASGYQTSGATPPRLEVVHVAKDGVITGKSIVSLRVLGGKDFIPSDLITVPANVVCRQALRFTVTDVVGPLKTHGNGTKIDLHNKGSQHSFGYSNAKTGKRGVVYLQSDFTSNSHFTGSTVNGDGGFGYSDQDTIRVRMLYVNALNQRVKQNVDLRVTALPTYTFTDIGSIDDDGATTCTRMLLVTNPVNSQSDFLNQLNAQVADPSTNEKEVFLVFSPGSQTPPNMKSKTTNGFKGSTAHELKVTLASGGNGALFGGSGWTFSTVNKGLGYFAGERLFFTVETTEANGLKRTKTYQSTVANIDRAGYKNYYDQFVVEGAHDQFFKYKSSLVGETVSETLTPIGPKADQFYYRKLDDLIPDPETPASGNEGTIVQHGAIVDSNNSFTNFASGPRYNLFSGTAIGTHPKTENQVKRGNVVEGYHSISANTIFSKTPLEYRIKKVIRKPGTYGPYSVFEDTTTAVQKALRPVSTISGTGLVLEVTVAEDGKISVRPSAGSAYAKSAVFTINPKFIGGTETAHGIDELEMSRVEYGVTSSFRREGHFYNFRKQGIAHIALRLNTSLQVTTPPSMYYPPSTAGVSTQRNYTAKVYSTVAAALCDRGNIKAMVPKIREEFMLNVENDPKAVEHEALLYPMFLMRDMFDETVPRLKLPLNNIRAIKQVKLVAYSMNHKAQFGVTVSHEQIVDEYMIMKIDEISGRTMSNNDIARGAFAVLQVPITGSGGNAAIEHVERDPDGIAVHDFGEFTSTVRNLTISMLNRNGLPAHIGRLHLWFKLLVQRG